MVARRYAKGRKAWGYCQRSGKRMLLNELVRDGHDENLLVAPEWYEPKHPKESLPAVEDPVTLYRPAPRTEAWNVTLLLPHYELGTDTTALPFTLNVDSGAGSISILEVDWIADDGDIIVTDGGEEIRFVE